MDNNWLDNSGHPGTEALHLTERFHRRDFGHIDLQITIDDPKAYTKPWNVNLQLTLTDTELIEYVCDEDEGRHAFSRKINHPALAATHLPV